MQLFTLSSLDLATNPVVTFLSPISSSSKLPCNRASPDKTPAIPFQSTSRLTTIIPDVAPPLSTGLQFSIPFTTIDNDQSETTQEIPPIN